MSTTVSAGAPRAIVININGRTVESDPPAVLAKGAVLVPLRGVLENLGAVVEYVAADRRIEITQGGKQVILRPGQDSAVVDLKPMKLTAAPVEIGGRVFVPMRSLAEIFGYRVNWLAPERTVSILSDGAQPLPLDHRAALAKAGAFGVTIDFTEATSDEVTVLLDQAKKAGAGFIKTRFDWATLEPTRGAAFQWPLYDRVVREARLRQLVVVGVLGNSAQWASVFATQSDAFIWRNAPPRDKELGAWQNYVRRTVGRYRQDVQAWQIWENPTPSRFRSSPRAYRIVVRGGIEAARASDPQAVLFVAEPGGVNLDFIDSLKRNGLTSRVSGVALYPVSQWQPGAPASPEDFLLPVSTLRSRMMPLGPTTRDFWVGGLAQPVVEGNIAQLPTADAGPLSKATDPATLARMARVFTPQAQADYLMRAATLALASGSEKVVWDALRDPAEYETVVPINPALGSGLLRRDGTTRPSFEAFSTLSKHLSSSKFVGSLAMGPQAIALLFNDGQNAHVAAWTLRGKFTVALNQEGLDPKLPNSLFIASLPATRILDATGKELFGAQGTYELGERPVWITNVGHEVVKQARKPEEKTLLVQQPAESKTEGEVRAEFVAPSDKKADKGGEAGIAWRKFATFRGVAQETVTLDGRTGLKTEYSRDIWNPADAKPFIYLDIADDYLYFERNVPVRVTVEVHRATPTSDPLSPSTAGFCLEYDSSEGPKRTEWKDLEAGEGWTSYSFDLPDASFANRGGFDLLINTFGAKQDVVFGAVTVRRMTNPAAPPTTPSVTAATPTPTPQS